MMQQEKLYPIWSRPRAIKNGEIAYLTHESLFAKRDEIALTLALITHRRLFGEVYLGIDPSYFYSMPQKSGVFVCPFLKTTKVAPDATNPGDIDLLIVPYEQDFLVMSKVVAVEVKIIRALYVKQSKSPNEFGFSQASHLYNLGFPYVAVAHLIVSDESPREAWRDVSLYQIIDDQGQVKPLPSRKHDMMPADLIQRSYGRLAKACPNPNFGIISAYLGSNRTLTSRTYHEEGIWMPFCRKATANPTKSDNLLRNIAAYLNLNPKRFLDNPRFDPE